MSDKLNEKMDQKRRDFLKGLATVPVFGFFLVNLWAKLRRDALKRKNLLTDLINEKKAPAVVSKLSDSKHLNIGIIGYGRLGRIISSYAKAFGMNILINDINQSKFKDSEFEPRYKKIR